MNVDAVVNVVTAFATGAAVARIVYRTQAAASRDRAFAARRRELEIYSKVGELLYSTDLGDEAAPGPPAKIEVSSSTDVSAADVGRIVEATQRTPAPAPEGWWSKHAGVVLAGLIGVGGVVFTAVWTTSQRDDAPPNCVEYAQVLGELRTEHPNAKSKELFGDGGLTFGDIADACGPPGQFFDGLG